MSSDALPAPGGPEPHGYGRRPNHQTPWWVPSDATFHIRVRTEPGSPSLTEPSIAKAVLDSVEAYAKRRRWHFAIFLLMPDHWHALLAFPSNVRMPQSIGDWKRWHTVRTGIRWQANFFDHRIRTDAEWEEKFRYIRNNPVVKGLCTRPADWPWQVIGTDDRGESLDATRLDR